MKIISIKNAIVKIDCRNEKISQDSIIEFANGDLGIVRSCNTLEANVILLKQNLRETLNLSTKLKATGNHYQVKISEKLLGKMLDASGVPIIDTETGKEILEFKHDASAECRNVDINNVVLMERTMVDRPLRTGIFMVDTLIPIGRGQRELILGDKNTGKTWLCVNTIIQNKNEDMIFIYNAIGKTTQEVNQVIAQLKEANVLKKTIIVAAFLNDTDAAQFYSAYLATTIAEYFREKKKDVFIIYDDLTKHGDAYRSLSIQIGQTPGREAFPGDIFYSHSRLLERSGSFTTGGSITSFPIVETIEENNASYLATNIISISDGQIMTSIEKYNNNILPAINYGPSVSRIGSSSQPTFIKNIKPYLITLFSGYENNERELKINVVNTNKIFLQNILNGYVISALFRQNKLSLLTFEEQWLFVVLVKNNCIMFLESVSEILLLRNYLLNEIFKKEPRVVKVLANLKTMKNKSDLQIAEELLVNVIKPIISKYLRNIFEGNKEKLIEIIEHYEGYNYVLGESLQLKSSSEVKEGFGFKKFTRVRK